jgi:hypothetical protein
MHVKVCLRNVNKNEAVSVSHTWKYNIKSERENTVWQDLQLDSFGARYWAEIRIFAEYS